MARPFRKPESYTSEHVTRKMLGEFLRRRGFIDISDQRSGHGQTIVATSPSGDSVTMRVHLCWRREAGSRDSNRERTYSAAQLLARVKNGDWEGSIREKIERSRSKNITHWLFVQRDDQQIVYAALVPVSEILSIWCAQRDISKRLFEQGRLGRRKKNHAMNGSSPTLWLQDDRAKEVADALWEHPGVRNLANSAPAIPERLPDEEADRDESPEKSAFIPQETDRRQIVERQIRERRGQQQFRDAVRKRYADRCLVTGCEVLAVLEAAHIAPYRGESDSHLENGLLLRADIHTLFDLDLIGIEPSTLRVELHPSIQKEYGSLAGRSLGCNRTQRPSLEALKLRYEQFQRRVDRPE